MEIKRANLEGDAMKRKNETFPSNMGRRKSETVAAETWVCCPVCWRDNRKGQACKCGGKARAAK